MLTTDLGKLAEDYAVKLLKSRGYKILDRNFHCRFGEIDIIAEIDEFLVFVEVKARWNQKFGSPIEAVTPQKLSKIKKTIDYYCLINSDNSNKIRIDVISLNVLNSKIVSSQIITLD